MNFKELDLSELPASGVRRGDPILRLSPVGILWLSESAKDLAKLKEGDKINFFENGTDWHLSKSEPGIELKEKMLAQTKKTSPPR